MRILTKCESNEGWGESRTLNSCEWFGEGFLEKGLILLIHEGKGIMWVNNQKEGYKILEVILSLSLSLSLSFKKKTREKKQDLIWLLKKCVMKIKDK